jgi:anti-sigma regulatory factor (Ser/Thr protein kinase)
MPFLACPNCGASVSGTPPPSICPACCAALHSAEELPALAAAGAAHRRRWPAAALRLPLVSDARSPSAAREALRDMRDEIGAERLPVVELLVSELVTNALIHGRPSAAADAADMRVRLCPDRVRVEVRDDGRGFRPTARTPDQDAGSGWGLHIVGELADAWGVEPGARNCVWFEVAR